VSAVIKQGRKRFVALENVKKNTTGSIKTPTFVGLEATVTHSMWNILGLGTTKRTFHFGRKSREGFKAILSK